MTKMTYVNALDYVLATVDNDEVREKLEALKGQLMKRSSGERKPTKTQTENESLKEDIFAYVSENGAKRASEVAVYFGMSGQKASALLKQLVEAGQVVKLIDKKVVSFDVAEDEQFLEDEVTA